MIWNRLLQYISNDSHLFSFMDADSLTLKPPPSNVPLFCYKAPYWVAPKSRASRVRKTKRGQTHHFFEDFICHFHPFSHQRSSHQSHSWTAGSNVGAAQTAGWACLPWPRASHRPQGLPSPQPGTAEERQASSLSVCLKNTKHCCICSPLSFKYLLKFCIFV